MSYLSSLESLLRKPDLIGRRKKMETKPKFAPGPWTLGRDGYNVDQICAANGDGVAQLYGLPLNTPVDELPKLIAARRKAYEGPAANAYLISAAPDLYRELRHLLRLIEPLEQGGAMDIPGLATMNGARAALAKADGAA